MAYAPQPMFRTLPSLLAAIFIASGCYSERLPPPAFRYDCGGDGECGDGESCIDGLCQVACTLATATEDCGLSGQGGSYLACINGVCSSACELDANGCPGQQSCAEIPGFSEQLGAGICMQECSEDSCPTGEICIEGFCAEACDAADANACGDGETCLFGVCVPDEVATAGGESQGTQGGAGETDGDTE